MRACACATTAFFAGRDFDTRGEPCLDGPYRAFMLHAGMFGIVLRTLLRPPLSQMLMWTGGLALMYLGTQAGTVDAADLDVLLQLLEGAQDVELLGSLLPTLWLLMRCGAARAQRGGRG